MGANSSNAVEKLIFVTARLIDVMQRELEFLNEMKPEGIRDLQAEKEDLANAYERQMAAIKSNPRLLRECDDEVKARLEVVTDRFAATMTENERSLRAVKSVSERLLNVIINAVAEKQAGVAYSASGTMGSGAIGAGQPLPLAVNESL
ncbi:MAG: hypothetical protein R3229_17885 [Alphaproteobacteria bacterium]|nr:hypothetical protein [Alphaproteobacteria bacterium]